MALIVGLLESKVLVTCFLAWFISQLIKFITVIAKHKKINFRLFIETGGMPSAHAAVVLALLTAVYFEAKFSALFAVSLIFAIIVIYDAITVRYAVGRQAAILNSINRDLHLSKVRLKELIGHSPREVFIGALLGTLVALGIYLI